VRHAARVSSPASERLWAGTAANEPDLLEPATITVGSSPSMRLRRHLHLRRHRLGTDALRLPLAASTVGDIASGRVGRSSRRLGCDRDDSAPWGPSAARPRLALGHRAPPDPARAGPSSRARRRLRGAAHLRRRSKTAARLHRLAPRAVASGWYLRTRSDPVVLVVRLLGGSMRGPRLQTSAQRRRAAMEAGRASAALSLKLHEELALFLVLGVNARA